jgi:UDP-N-acetylmuramoylalanine--D-glutamate ligase
LKPISATVLNISEDHLDRYASMADYAAAKARIYKNAQARVANREDECVMKMVQAESNLLSFGTDIPKTDRGWGLNTFENQIWLMRGQKKLMALKELPVAGLHNAANALAALALCYPLNASEEKLLQALRDFRGLPHRVQKVAEVKGVEFYDDSKGTNVGATVAALHGIGRAAKLAKSKIVLIAGGDGKGQDFSPLKPVIAECGRAVVLIGRDGEKIALAIHNSGIPIARAGSMEEAVDLSFEKAISGDVVLMSPACASFDMFRNYEHRAEVFVQAVKRLASRHQNV